ncbi:uncharacterized protein Z520_07561 [Fonsecaea multimorphosa CBS 102226]|uniref:Low temperature requirement protein A n=1 Tax=Fonsecaea multimorphosa CBS 102226 TaxID=1442371 RepID=A0A0D2IIJ4_9EURO|nr:uncharacterized protein Z520_07561 [Fonsecaea multimorphosa CBS 102226]KIX96841.1 hypothetical protein Z520_07561 [Fonsecaea multimorphosa CBS 102226]OAL22520.1 hypothetical protein AYO22_07078 [Fonsecaea multimorphosa]
MDSASLPEQIRPASIPDAEQDGSRDKLTIQDASPPSDNKHGLSLNVHVDSHASHEHTHHHAEIRARHRYTIRRPRALQFSYRSQVIHAGDERGLHETNSRSSISSHLPEDIAKERERLDLFIDLIWVGIIGNLSEVFSSLGFRAEDPNLGIAILVFTLVFLPSWRIWDAMREFLNNYYMDDMVQRAFTLWILLLSVFYGNQLAYLTKDIDEVKQWVISTYLVIFGAFWLIELAYSIFIKWLRKLVFFQTILRLPSIALWVTAIQLPGARAIGPVCGAIVWEYLCPIIMDSQVTARLTPIEVKKALDVHHFQSRMSNFFIIILGEGVLQLVKDGPLGLGLNGSTGVMIWILMIYYEFSFLYFNRDGSRKFVPAATKRGQKTLMWVFWHIPLFSSILTFASSVMFIIRHQPDAPYNSLTGQASAEKIPQDDLPLYLYRAVWTCATSLGVIMLSMTALALLDKSLDEPATLKINNRYIRLAGRIVYIIVIPCVPAAHNIDADLFLGIAAFMLLGVTVWEWNVGLDKGGALIEPLGLSHMMSRELKA